MEPNCNFVRAFSQIFARLQSKAVLPKAIKCRQNFVDPQTDRGTCNREFEVIRERDRKDHPCFVLSEKEKEDFVAPYGCRLGLTIEKISSEVHNFLCVVTQGYELKFSQKSFSMRTRTNWLRTPI